MNHRKTATEVAAQLQDVLQDGDIVFTRLANPFARRIADASASWTSHVGLAFRNPTGGWRIAESRVPLSCYSSLDSFIARSEDCGVVVKRYGEGLSGTQAAALRTEAEQRFGLLYDTGFKYDRGNRAFCSKFAYDAYRMALGIEIGRKESFRELLLQNPRPQLGFWRWWYFGEIPWERVTVTPASQFDSPLLRSVYERRRDLGGGAAPRNAPISSSQYTE